MGKGNEEETFEQLKRQLLVRPDSAPLHYNLGLAHGRRKEWDEAITELKTALELNPGLLEARINLGGDPSYPVAWILEASINADGLATEITLRTQGSA